MFARALFTLPLLVCAACSRAPAEPAASAPATSRPAVAPTSRYQPALEDSARRVLAALPSAPATAPPAVARIESVPALPPTVDLVSLRISGQRPVAAAVEPDRVSLGLDAVARVLALWNTAQDPPDASRLTRLVAALHYPAYRAFDGIEWTSPPHAHGTRPSEAATPPHLEARPGGGRTLLFSYWISDGAAGAGPHLGNFRVTDSNLVIDLAPMPEVR